MISTAIPNTSFQTVMSLIAGYSETANNLVIPYSTMLFFASDTINRTTRSENISTTT